MSSQNLVTSLAACRNNIDIEKQLKMLGNDGGYYGLEGKVLGSWRRRCLVDMSLSFAYPRCTIDIDYVNGMV